MNYLSRVKSLLSRQSGQGQIEYGIVIFLVGLGVVVALVLTGGQVGHFYSNIVVGLHS